jgi:GH15 family glucan-1,4-alpha-glucosidase
VLDKLYKAIIDKGVQNGHFIKHFGSKEVDANLIGLATPYRIIAPDDPKMCATINRIETELSQGGGLHRYLGDTYFGGGEWILLTAWLGWYWAERGERDRARQLLNWIELQADEQGALPEQVPENLVNSAYYEVWQERWGEIARPLLWSHAKYLILHHTLTHMR